MFVSANRQTRELGLTQLSLAVTGTAAALLLWSTGKITWSALQQQDLLRFLEAGLFGVLSGFLVYGNLCYQVARLGRLRRFEEHRASDADDAVSCFGADAPGLTILIPSYKEEISVIRQTLLSAALQDYPNKRVVLLLDDPPAPKTRQDLASLWAARSLPFELTDASGFCLPPRDGGEVSVPLSAIRERQGAQRRVCVSRRLFQVDRRNGSRRKRSSPRSTRTQMSGLSSISSRSRPRPAVHRPQNGSLGEITC